MVIRAALLLFNPDFSASSVSLHRLCLVEMTCLGTREFLPWAVDTGLLMHPSDGSPAFLARLCCSSTGHSDLPIQLRGDKLMWAEGKTSLDLVAVHPKVVLLLQCCDGLWNVRGVVVS